MDDLISRQNALDEIHRVYEYEFPTASGAFDEFVTMIIPNILRNLPSAYQQGEVEMKTAKVDKIDNCIDCLLNKPKAESELKWISVSERLPKKESKSYWVCTDTKYQCECRWTNNIYGIGESSEWGWKIFDIPQYTKVVAWMPLPSSYQGE